MEVNLTALGDRQALAGLPVADTVRRGSPLQLTTPAPAGATVLVLTGTWSGRRRFTQWSTPRALPCKTTGTERLAVVDSAFWWSELAPIAAEVGPTASFAGTAQWQGVDGPLGPTWPVTLTLAPTVQVIVLHMQTGLDEALALFGLQVYALELRALVLQRVRQHFARWSVVVLAQPPTDVTEYLTIDITGEDPNGKHMLGNDNSLGKDVGNRTLGEQLMGYNPSRAAVGEPAWGGVFVSELMQFSDQLRPYLTSSSKEFDVLFGPYAPVLGGQPAAATKPPVAALLALSNLIAGTAAHEVGHALGLAAGTQAYHHPDDHPGWLMDNGSDRSFAERAELPGAVEVRWGPADSDYLSEILPK